MPSIQLQPLPYPLLFGSNKLQSTLCWFEVGGALSLHCGVSQGLLMNPTMNLGASWAVIFVSGGGRAPPTEHGSALPGARHVGRMGSWEWLDVKAGST